MTDIFQLMIPWLVFLPKSVSLMAMGGLMVAGIQELRQGHIGRIGIALNAFFLWQVFFPLWASLPDWFALYLDAGTIVAAVAIFAYFKGNSLPTQFYQLAFLAYGSISTVLIVAVALSNGILS